MLRHRNFENNQHAIKKTQRSVSRYTGAPEMIEFTDIIKIRIINKRGYVYVGRANAGQAVEIQIKPKNPTIIIKEGRT